MRRKITKESEQNDKLR